MEDVKSSNACKELETLQLKSKCLEHQVLQLYISVTLSLSLCLSVSLSLSLSLSLAFSLSFNVQMVPVRIYNLLSIFSIDWRSIV